MKTFMIIFLAMFAGATILNAQSGNVGIGTSTPNSKLDVNGDLRVRKLPSADATDSIVMVDPAGEVHRMSLIRFKEIVEALAPSSGIVATLNCSGATQTGTLMAGQVASGVTKNVPYTGGNGKSFSAINIPSSGVTGLTASAQAGNLANGNGTLILSITGTPTASGTASFPLTLGGKTCTVTANVEASGPPDPNLSSCSLLLRYSDFPGGSATFSINGKDVQVTMSYNGSTATQLFGGCGVSSRVGGWWIYNTTLTFRFSQPVSNVQFVAGLIDKDETLTFTATNGGQSVTPKLTAFGGNCQDVIVVSGNQLTTNYPLPRANAGTYVNIGGSYFTELTVQESAVGTAGALGLCLMLCNAVTQ